MKGRSGGMLMAVLIVVDGDASLVKLALRTTNPTIRRTLTVLL